MIEIIHDLFANSQKLISVVLILVLIGGLKISYSMATKKSVDKVYRKLDDMEARKADKVVVESLQLAFKNYQAEINLSLHLLRNGISKDLDDKLKPLSEAIKSTDSWVRHLCKTDKKDS